MPGYELPDGTFESFAEDPSMFSAANYVGPEAAGPPPVEHPIDDAVEWVAEKVAGGWVSEHTGSGGYETVVEPDEE